MTLVTLDAKIQALEDKYASKRRDLSALRVELSVLKAELDSCLKTRGLFSRIAPADLELLGISLDENGEIVQQA